MKLVTAASLILSLSVLKVASGDRGGRFGGGKDIGGGRYNVGTSERGGVHREGDGDYFVGTSFSSEKYKENEGDQAHHGDRVNSDIGGSYSFSEGEEYIGNGDFKTHNGGISYNNRGEGDVSSNEGGGFSVVESIGGKFGGEVYDGGEEGGSQSGEQSYFESGGGSSHIGGNIIDREEEIYSEGGPNGSNGYNGEEVNNIGDQKGYRNEGEKLEISGGEFSGEYVEEGGNNGGYGHNGGNDKHSDEGEAIYSEGGEEFGYGGGSDNVYNGGEAGGGGRSESEYDGGEYGKGERDQTRGVGRHGGGGDKSEGRVDYGGGGYGGGVAIGSNIFNLGTPIGGEVERRGAGAHGILKK